MSPAAKQKLRLGTIRDWFLFFLAHLLLCNLIIRKFLNFSAAYLTHIIIFNSHWHRNSQVEPHFFLKPFKLCLWHFTTKLWHSAWQTPAWLWIIKILTFFTHLPSLIWWFHMPCLASSCPRQQTKENSSCREVFLQLHLFFLAFSASLTDTSLETESCVLALNYVEVQFRFPEQ